MNELPLLRISPGDLEGLLGTLDVSFVALTECVVSMGYSLDLGGMNAPGIHYNVGGTGRAVFGNRDPIPLMPHTLIIVPPNSPFRIEVEGSMGFTALRSVKKQPQMTSSSTIRRFSAGDGDPSLRQR